MSPVHVAPELPALANASSSDAFAESIAPHLPHLHALARRVLRSPDLAADAVQEALLACWRLPAPPPQPRAWLLRAVLLRSLHLARSRRRRCQHEAGACTCGAPPQEPLSSAQRREFAEQLHDALAALPELHREIFLLRERDGLDYPQIAERLAIPIGTVRSRLHRARHALRERLPAALAG